MHVAISAIVSAMISEHYCFQRPISIIAHLSRQSLSYSVQLSATNSLRTRLLKMTKPVNNAGFGVLISSPFISIIEPIERRI